MKFSLRHYLFPIICVLVALICQYSGLDINLAKNFYDPQHHLWPYQSSWLTQEILHDDARDVIVLIYLSVALFFIATQFPGKLRPYRRTTGFVLLASLTGIILVGALKDTTHLYTPWDLKIFAGQHPNIRLFDSVASNLPVGHAFPSGHASGGFALVSLYFAARYHQHRHSLRFLYGALALGMLLGIDQQIRGAHMMSHDLFALSICWVSGLFWSHILLPSPSLANNHQHYSACEIDDHD